MTRKAPVNKDTWLEYARGGGHCGLCGNSGFIGMSGLKTSAGILVVAIEKVPCICPNGRAIKYARDKEAPMRAENDPAYETCPQCGRVDLDAYMCWRVGHLPKKETP